MYAVSKGCVSSVFSVENISPEALVNFYQFTGYHLPKDSSLPFIVSTVRTSNLKAIKGQ
jgi:hypothetical protein